MAKKSAKNGATTPSPLWTIEQVAVWIETRDARSVDGDTPYCRGANQRALNDLRRHLIEGRVKATASADASAPREIASAEWAECIFEPYRTFVVGLSRAGTTGNWFVRVRSTRAFRAAALKDHSCQSSMIVRDAKNPGGALGFHRVLHGVRFRKNDVVLRWPRRSRTQPTPSAINGAERECVDRLKSMFAKSPNTKTIEKGALFSRWSAGPNRIDHLSKRAFDRAWQEVFSVLPPTSPWRKPGRVSQRRSAGNFMRGAKAQ